MTLTSKFDKMISHIFVATISNFVLMHQNNRDCSLPFLGNCDIDLWPQLYKNRVPSISSML